MKIKEKCQRKDFADGLHCKLINPELFDSIVKTIKPTTGTQPKLLWTPEAKKALLDLLKNGVSLRSLEKFLKFHLLTITKSTIQRWFKDDFKNDFKNDKKQKSYLYSINNNDLTTLNLNEFFGSPSHPLTILKNFQKILSKKMQSSSEQFFTNIKKECIKKEWAFGQ